MEVGTEERVLLLPIMTFLNTVDSTAILPMTSLCFRWMSKTCSRKMFVFVGFFVINSLNGTRWLKNFCKL